MRTGVGAVRATFSRTKNTPEAYCQERSANGSSCSMSRTRLVTRARASASPLLNTVCRASAGTTSSQLGVSWLAGGEDDGPQHHHGDEQLLQLHHVDASGSVARGKCSARTRPRFAAIEREPDSTARWV